MNGLIKIEFPKDKVLRRNNSGSEEIFDAIRKTWVALTPEEWVRQHFIQFLFTQSYPAPLIAVEKQITLAGLTKRFDIVAYSRDMRPFMIIECKRMDVSLSEKVLAQALRYHASLECPYLIITNGAYTLGYHKKNDRFEPVNSFPKYPD
ncbi:MAG: type I restriction enzyme HsdR N-terminal domain-containing protein [Chitinophagaceae bacterium]|nr:type I restriction enzyme HsdR N-terminal domain-containing protein [Chitinophagaceae bacterium]